jgi:sugar fermentation stimulation protein A
VEQIRVGRHWICVNTGRPNAIVAEAIGAGGVRELAGYTNLRREVQLGHSRVDLLLEGPGRCWVEVKNITLLRGDVLGFPDAVTTRGTKHLHTLTEAVRGGDRAVIFLHVGHEGGDVVVPARDVDPTWATALDDAVSAGVEVLAYRAEMDLEGVRLAGPVPFRQLAI